jgi:6-phosphogluconolactonase
MAEAQRALRRYEAGMIEAYPHANALAEAAAAGVSAALADALATRGRAALVATGGRSPGPVYDRLTRAPIDWARVVVTLSDERCVPPDAPESNARVVRERLLQGPGAPAHLLPLWPPPQPQQLEALLPFDAVMLGMGEDGHVASLIPGDPGLEAAYATTELVREVPAGPGNPPVARITLTLAALAPSRAIFLLIAGEAKRDVLTRAEAGEDLPVGRLMRTAQGRVRVFWAPSHGG